MSATIKPYSPNTSAKIRMTIIPTNSYKFQNVLLILSRTRLIIIINAYVKKKCDAIHTLGCCPVPRTPASPTIPIA